MVKNLHKIKITPFFWNIQGLHYKIILDKYGSYWLEGGWAQDNVRILAKVAKEVAVQSEKLCTLTLKPDATYKYGFNLNSYCPTHALTTA